MGSKNNEPSIRFIGFNDNWEQRKLREVVDVCSGRDYKHLSKGDIPVYGTGGYMLSVSDALSFEDDAIGIGRKGTIDKPYMLKSPFWTVDTLFYAIPKVGYNLTFVYNIFRNINWKQKDESTGVPSLSRRVINNTNVFVARHEEQVQIGFLFSNLDNLISLHQRKLDNLEILKKTFLDKLFPKNNKTIPLFRFSGFNDDWEQMKLKNVLREKNIQHPQNEEYPLVSFTAELGVTPKTERYEREQLVVGKKNHKNYKATQFNDIVYNPANLKFGAISRNTYGNAVFSPIYITFLVNLNYLSEFVEMYVTRKNFINFALKYQQGTVYERQAVHPNDFLKLDIKLPCISEQTCLAELYKEINDIITLHQIKVEHLENLKKYFLNNMFI